MKKDQIIMYEGMDNRYWFTTPEREKEFLLQVNGFKRGIELDLDSRTVFGLDGCAAVCVSSKVVFGLEYGDREVCDNDE